MYSNSNPYTVSSEFGGKGLNAKVLIARPSGIIMKNVLECLKET